MVWKLIFMYLGSRSLTLLLQSVSLPSTSSLPRVPATQTALTLLAATQSHDFYFGKRKPLILEALVKLLVCMWLAVLGRFCPGREYGGLGEHKHNRKQDYLHL